MKLFEIIVSWIVTIAVCFGVWWLWNRFSLPPMTGSEVLFFGLSLAFCWVEKLKWGSVKPFNCTACLTGWFALLLAILFHVDAFYLYLPAGVFVGAMFEAIKMRWL